jgi:hypothetical protein
MALYTSCVMMDSTTLPSAGAATASNTAAVAMAHAAGSTSLAMLATISTPRH